MLQHFADYPVPDFNNGLCDAHVDPFGVDTGRCRWQAENGAIHWTEGFPIFLSEVLTRFWGYEGFGGPYRSRPAPAPGHELPSGAGSDGHDPLEHPGLGDGARRHRGDGHGRRQPRCEQLEGQPERRIETIWDAIVNFDPAPSDPAHNHPQTIDEFWPALRPCIRISPTACRPSTTRATSRCSRRTWR